MVIVKTSSIQVCPDALKVRQGAYPDKFRDKNQVGKTINHTFRKRIAKMANLSQYCTSFMLGG